MDDNDPNRDTGGEIPDDSHLLTKGRDDGCSDQGNELMVGSGADGSTYAHGTQALDFEMLVKRAGVSPAKALQAGTMTNAEALGWADRIGSIEQGRRI